MANIAIVTETTGDAAATNLVTTLQDLGHIVTLHAQGVIVESGASQLQSFDVVMCPRINASDPSTANILLELLTAGTPVVTGTYSGVAVSGTWTTDTILEIRLGLTTQLVNNNGTDSTINVVSTELGFYDNEGLTAIYNSSSFMYSFTKDGLNIPDYTIANDLTNSRTNLMVLDEGYVYNASQPALTAKYISFGGLYGRGGFSGIQTLAFERMINWLITAEKTHEVNGVTSFNGSPFGLRVFAVSNDVENPLMLGFTTSDALTGEYSIPVAYNKPVMVFTMQDYGEAWQPSVTLVDGDTVHPTVDNGYFYKVTQAGNTGTNEPTWPTTVGEAVTDGGVTYITELLLKPEIAGYKTPTPIN